MFVPIPFPKLIHKLPGRLRLLVPTILRNPDLASRLTTHLCQQKNILDCTVNPVSGRLLLIYDAPVYTESQLCDMVYDYLQQSSISRAIPPRQHKAFEPEDVSIPVQISLVTAGGLLLLYHLYQHLRGRMSITPTLERNTSMITLLTAFPILRSGIEHLIVRRKLNNDLLIASATLLSLLLREGATGLVVIWLVNLSTLIETLTLDRSRRTIRAMLEGTEKNAWVLINEQEISVPLPQLKVNDTVVARIGSKIPIDGTVVQGAALVNQAALTGEPLPVHKQIGDPVLAGSTVEEGTLYIQAEKVGDDTSVARIIHMVETASHARAPIQNIADQYSAKIIPVSFLLAAAVFLLTRDIHRTMTILIVACPCAAGLATPTALSAAIGNAASRGILIKGGRYLEEAGRVDMLLFDKTGTLTSGRPSVVRIIPLRNDVTEQAILALAAAAETNANHPLAQAIIETARAAGITIQRQPNSEMAIGRGVRAVIETKAVFVGSAHYMTDIGIQLSAASTFLEQIDPGATLLYVAEENELIGVIALKDTLRPEANAALHQIRAEGVTELGLVTGDTEVTAGEIARHLGISHVWSNMMPQDKFQLIKSLQKEGYIVGMVGDGVNDSPALALANVGIAMGAGGTDAAIETAGIVLREDNPLKIADVVKLGKNSLTIIRQNFLLAIGANIIGLGLGSAKLISPFMAAILHNASTLGVVLNSTRLLRHNSADPSPDRSSKT
jgi:manganese/zinc-transporting P-type ATPase C